MITEHDRFIKAFIFFFVGCLIGCTENPVTDNEISNHKRRIAGRVELIGNHSPEGVFVWLDGFEYQTRTTAAGEFELTLPPKNAQANSNGVTGAFNLYFFVSNYRIESLTIQLVRGEIVYSPDVFDNDGNLRRPVILAQLLNVYSEMIPDTVTTEQKGLLQVRLLFRTTQEDTVRAVFPSKVGSTAYPILFQNIETEEVKVFGSTIVGVPLEASSDTLKITRNRPVETERLIHGNPTDFAAGKYKVIPFVRVLQDGIPQKLLDSIGPGVNQLGPGYLELPFFRQGGNFEVIASAPSL